MANLVGDLGKQLNDSVSKSLSGFAAGMKSAAIAGNPAVFGPAFNKLEKLFKDDREEKKRAQAFEEEKALEQRKLFTDILGEQKETNNYLRQILEAFNKLKGDDSLHLKNLIHVMIGLGALFKKKIGELVKGLIAFLKALEGKFKDLFGKIGDFFRNIFERLRGFARAIENVLDFIKNLFGRFGPALSRLLDFLGDLS